MVLYDFLPITVLSEQEVIADNLEHKPDTAAHECVSEDALVHLKSYKYSSVDKSLISRYILRHYVGSDSKGSYLAD